MAKIAREDAEYDPNNVTIYVKKHKVVVKNGTIVHIHHEKCVKPCDHSKEIVSYLVAEAFITAASVVLAETYETETES